MAANLAERSSKLAGMYTLAVSTFEVAPQKGCERARVSVICHCMRELMLGLPPVLNDSAEARPDPSSNKLLGKLPRLLTHHPDVDLTADQDIVPVPREVAVHLAELIRTRTQEDGRNRRNISALIAGDDSSNHPAIKEWQGAYRFFVRWAHLDRDNDQASVLPTDQEIEANMRIVEDLVEGWTAAFFENLRAVQDLLDTINAAVEESE
jgi:hypothetical protein